MTDDIDAEHEDRNAALAQQGQAAIAETQGVQPPISFSEGMQMLPVEQMRSVLAEYSRRKAAFREWLREALTEGVHYGYPPGCAPRRDAQGNVVDKRGNIIPAASWTHKPSLYQAGADLLVDLLQWQVQYELDSAAWEQAGKPANTFFVRCILSPTADPDRELGQGLGSCGPGKDRDHNGALKMACKRAKVAAVLNVLGISDLFTQDMEPPPANPQARLDRNAADAPTREERSRTDGLSEHLEIWKEWARLAVSYWGSTMSHRELSQRYFAYLRGVLGRQVTSDGMTDEEAATVLAELDVGGDPRPPKERSGE